MFEPPAITAVRDLEGAVLLQHRAVTVVDTAVVLTAAFRAGLGAGVNGLLPTRGVRQAELRFWSSAVGATGVFTVAGWPARIGLSGLAKGRVLAAGTFTCGSGATADINPVTGAATPGVTLYEAHGLALTTPRGVDEAPAPVWLYAAGLHNLESTLVIDPRNMDLHCFITTMSGNRVEVGARLVG